MNGFQKSDTGSLILRLWAALCAVYDDSALHRFLARAGRWCSRQIDGSVLLRSLCREGALAHAWTASFSCRLLTGLVNLPATLLHRLYTAFQPLFDHSFFARLGFAMGGETAVAESWLIMLLWCIPFDNWNNAYNLLAYLLLLALFFVGAMGRKDFRLRIGEIGFYPVLLFGAIFLAMPLSSSTGLSSRFLLYHIIAALCVLVTVSAVRSTEQLKRLAAGCAVVVLGAGLYGIMQRIQGVKVNKSYVDLSVNAGMPGRVQSFFDNPNTFAQVLTLLLPIVLALLLCSRHWFSKLLAAGCFVVGGAALGMTYSRACWVGIACAMVVMVFLWKPKLIPAFVVVCLAAVPFLPDTIWNRILTITNTADSSTLSRVSLYKASFAVIEQSPVQGAGLGTAAVKEFIRANNLYHGRAPFVHAHNFYLQVWMEMGLLGIAAFLGAMLWNIKNAARAVRHSANSAARTIACGGAAALCGIMVGGMADYPWNYPRVLSIFWFVFALTIAATRLCLRSGAAED